MEEHHLVARIVLNFGQAEFHGHHMIDAAAQICGSQAHEALEKQPGRDQQHHRQRDLNCQHRLAQTRTRGAAADRSRRLPQRREYSLPVEEIAGSRPASIAVAATSPSAKAKTHPST